MSQVRILRFPVLSFDPFGREGAGCSHQSPGGHDSARNRLAWEGEGAADKAGRIVFVVAAMPDGAPRKLLDVSKLTRLGLNAWVSQSNTLKYKRRKTCE